MNTLSMDRLKERYLCFYALHALLEEITEEQWAALTQKEMFDKAMKWLGKSSRVNPSTMQTIIEELEKFQLPRNVQEQEHVVGQI